MKANCYEAKFLGAKLTGADFHECNLLWAIFKKSKGNVDLNAFDGADVGYADFTNSCVTKAHLLNARNVDKAVNVPVRRLSNASTATNVTTPTPTPPPPANIQKQVSRKFGLGLKESTNKSHAANGGQNNLSANSSMSSLHSATNNEKKEKEDLNMYNYQYRMNKMNSNSANEDDNSSNNNHSSSNGYTNHDIQDKTAFNNYINSMNATANSHSNNINNNNNGNSKGNSQVGTTIYYNPDQKANRSFSPPPQ